MFESYKMEECLKLDVPVSLKSDDQWRFKVNALFYALPTYEKSTKAQKQNSGRRNREIPDANEFSSRIQSNTKTNIKCMEYGGICIT